MNLANNMFFMDTKLVYQTNERTKKHKQHNLLKSLLNTLQKFK